MSFICSFPNCGRSFDSQKGLFWHQRKDLSHNLEKSYTNITGNIRHQIFYESHNSLDHTTSRLHKKARPASGVQYIDLDQMKDALIHSSDDDNDYDTQRLGEDEDDDIDDSPKLNNTVCWTEMCFTILFVRLIRTLKIFYILSIQILMKSI